MSFTPGPFAVYRGKNHSPKSITFDANHQVVIGPLSGTNVTTAIQAGVIPIAQACKVTKIAASMLLQDTAGIKINLCYAGQNITGTVGTNGQPAAAGDVVLETPLTLTANTPISYNADASAPDTIFLPNSDPEGANNLIVMVEDNGVETTFSGLFITLDMTCVDEWQSLPSIGEVLTPSDY